MWYDVEDSTTFEDAVQCNSATTPASSSESPSTVSTLRTQQTAVVSGVNSSLPPPNFYDLPQNFYWALPQKIIGMACPNKRKHVSNLYNHFGVSVIINLREYTTPNQLFAGTNVRNVHLPIKSFGVPTLEQVEYSIRIIEETLHPSPESSSLEIETNISAENPKTNGANKEAIVSEDNPKTTTTSTQAAVAINCRGGKGRTGTIICCYLIYKEGITAHEAIKRIRELSPRSVETRGQEEFIEEYYRLTFVTQGRESEYRRSLPFSFVPQSATCKILVVPPNPANKNNANSGGNNKPICRPSYPARDAFMNHPHQRELIMSRFCELK